MSITKQDIYFIISLLTAIYFALVCSAWTYLINVILGIPVFLISYYFWKIGMKKDIKIKRYQYIRYIWYIGFVISIISLIGFLIFN
jgi:hypothetical protein